MSARATKWGRVVNKSIGEKISDWLVIGLCNCLLIGARESATRLNCFVTERIAWMCIALHTSSIIASHILRSNWSGSKSSFQSVLFAYSKSIEKLYFITLTPKVTVNLDHCCGELRYISNSWSINYVLIK